ncbi:MAG: protein tyrosine kinase, partial [Chloroflexi bacterium]|nr:protein tyrosine kinase [Chloroflexota bacterium]
MELKQYLEMARRWAWLLILGMALGAIGGYAASLYQTPIYQASTRILALRASQSASTDIAFLNDQQLAQTYIQLLTTKPVLDSAATELGFPIDAAQLRVQQVGTTQVIQLTVEDNDPARSAS